MPRERSNPPNPWATAHVEWLGEPPPVETVVVEEEARSLLSKNESPDVPFAWGVNPYRGCAHACAYCYARPTHEYLGYGAGTDFDSRIVVKTNAPELLSLELARPSWRKEVVCLSGNTDPYQPLEAHYGLSRRLLEIFLARRTPVCVITKGALIRRDVDLLAKLAERGDVEVHISLAFLDPAVARAMDPGAPSPAVRFETIRLLSEAGIPTGIACSPIVPGLNDHDIPELLERAAAAGARRAFGTLLRLPGSTAHVFEERLRAAFPGRADKVLSAVRTERGGALHEKRFGARMAGTSARWQATERLFRVTARRLGLEVGETSRPAVPDRPGGNCQGQLFS